MNDTIIAVNTSNRSANPKTRYIAFEGQRLIATGELADVVRKAKDVIDRGGRDPVLIFDEVTSKQIEVDFRGTADEVMQRLDRTEEIGSEESEVTEKRGPGRPKLGVVAREVTLLPRHWDWLNDQPGGASVALRRLVEEARRTNQKKDQARHSQESVHWFMYNMAGDLPGFEEASRAFYARNNQRFDEVVEAWPADIRDHLKKLVTAAHRDEVMAKGGADR